MHISISRQSWFLRLFIAAWGVDPEELNFCKFFWGALFIWLAPVAKLFDRLTDPFNRAMRWLVLAR